MKRIVCAVLIGTALFCSYFVGTLRGIAHATTSEGYFLGDSKFFLIVDGNIYEWDNDYVK